MEQKHLEDLVYNVIGAAYEVRRCLGRFLLEKTYEQALKIELELRGIKSERQFLLPVIYKGIKLQDAYKVDLLVENVLPVELKSISVMGSSDVHQILSYMSFGQFPLGLLINFGAEDFVKARTPEDMYLDKGIYRFAKGFTQ